MPAWLQAAPSHLVLVTGARSWTDEQVMREAFNDLWRRWGAATVTAPLLVSGNAPSGADAMAEKLWDTAGLPVLRLPAAWNRHGRAAGPRRNQAMVDLAQTYAGAGTTVVCLAFIGPCTRESCNPGEVEDVGLPAGQHLSHGTHHCRTRAIASGIEVIDVLEH